MIEIVSGLAEGRSGENWLVGNVGRFWKVRIIS